MFEEAGRRGGSEDELDLTALSPLPIRTDHILSMQSTLLHYEQILSQAQPAYVSQLRVSLAVTRGVTDKAILSLSVVSIGILPMQFISGSSLLHLSPLPSPLLTFPSFFATRHVLHERQPTPERRRRSSSRRPSQRLWNRRLRGRSLCRWGHRRCTILEEEGVQYEEGVGRESHVLNLVSSSFSFVRPRRVPLLSSSPFYLLFSCISHLSFSLVFMLYLTRFPIYLTTAHLA